MLHEDIDRAFENINNKVALIIGQAPNGDPRSLNEAFYAGCESREYAAKLGFQDKLFELSVRINALAAPVEFDESRLEADPNAIDRVRRAVKKADKFGIKIVCCFGSIARLAITELLKDNREAPKLYQFSIGSGNNPPYLFTFHHPSPLNPVWNETSNKENFRRHAANAEGRITSRASVNRPIVEPVA